MAWIVFSIFFIGLTTTSGYKFPYTNYHQPYESQNYGASQYRRVDDSSLEQDQLSGGYQERSSNIRSNDQPRNENSSYKILNSLPKTYPSVINRRGVDSESAVVFPGPTSGTRRKFTPEITEDCGELGICENSPDYPHEHVEALLAKLPDAKIRFNLDVETPEIAMRGGHEQPSSNHSVELCKPDVRIIYPDKVRTKAGKAVYIVNGSKNKVQGFRGTQCRAPGNPCVDLIYLPPNYKALCEQKMMDRSMWAIDENGEMQLVTVPMPSCCMCVLQVVQ